MQTSCGVLIEQRRWHTPTRIHWWHCVRYAGDEGSSSTLHAPSNNAEPNGIKCTTAARGTPHPSRHVSEDESSSYPDQWPWECQHAVFLHQHAVWTASSRLPSIRKPSGFHDRRVPHLSARGRSSAEPGAYHEHSSDVGNPVACAFQKPVQFWATAWRASSTLRTVRRAGSITDAAFLWHEAAAVTGTDPDQNSSAAHVAGRADAWLGWCRKQSGICRHQPRRRSHTARLWSQRPRGAQRHPRQPPSRPGLASERRGGPGVETWALWGGHALLHGSRLPVYRVWENPISAIEKGAKARTNGSVELQDL